MDEDVSMLSLTALAEAPDVLELELLFECTLLGMAGRREACAACTVGRVPSKAWKVIGESSAERVVAPDSNLI